MTRPLLAFLKQGCLWELMCTKIKNKFVSNSKKIWMNFFRIDPFSIKENWKSLRIKIIFSQKKYLLSFRFFVVRSITSQSSFANFLQKRKRSWVKNEEKFFFIFIFFAVSQIKKFSIFWSMHRSKRIKNRTEKLSIEKKIEQEK